MEDAREILSVFCSSWSSPGKVAWKAAGIRSDATDTVNMEAEVCATRLLYCCSFRLMPPRKKHMPRIYSERQQRTYKKNVGQNTAKNRRLYNINLSLSERDDKYDEFLLSERI